MYGKGKYITYFGSELMFIVTLNVDHLNLTELNLILSKMSTF